MTAAIISPSAVLLTPPSLRPAARPRPCCLSICATAAASVSASGLICRPRLAPRCKRCHLLLNQRLDRHGLHLDHRLDGRRPRLASSLRQRCSCPTGGSTRRRGSMTAAIISPAAVLLPPPSLRPAARPPLVASQSTQPPQPPSRPAARQPSAVRLPFADTFASASGSTAPLSPHQRLDCRHLRLGQRMASGSITAALASPSCRVPPSSRPAA
jgi:hypothetical protein